ncbi:MAG: HD domain-containing phosphohydrolase [Desulfohalobiaceae bacterium]
MNEYKFAQAIGVEKLLEQDKASILVADDESSLREICSEALEGAGYQVFQATDGQMALALLQENPVDLVLSDMRMPKLNGLQLLENIVDLGLDVDFVVMTGFGTIETAVEIMKKGALDYLPKPFDINHLMLKVEKALEHRKQRQERQQLNNLVGVLKLSQDLNNQLELNTLLNEFIFHLERNFFPSSSGVFLKPDPSTKELQLSRVQGEILRSDPNMLSLAKKICTLVLDKKDSQLIDPSKPSQDQDIQGLTQRLSSWLSMLAAPMYHNEEPIGVVLLIRDSSKRGYFLEDLQLLTVFASQTASAIENARLYGQMQEMNKEVIRSFAQAVEAKDMYTRGHSDHVAYYALRLGHYLGLGKTEMEHLHLAGIVHDIGKIGIPDHILNKPDKLTPEEYGVMKKHPEVGRSILSQVGSLKEILPTIYHHHEQIDGRGYPEGLKDGQIPFLSKVISVVDAFDAMSSDRAYRNALPLSQVKEILQAGAGTQWDKDLVNLWLRIVDKEKLPLK